MTPWARLSSIEVEAAGLFREGRRANFTLKPVAWAHVLAIFRLRRKLLCTSERYCELYRFVTQNLLFHRVDADVGVQCTHKHTHLHERGPRKAPPSLDALDQRSLRNDSASQLQYIKPLRRALLTSQPAHTATPEASRVRRRRRNSEGGDVGHAAHAQNNICQLPHFRRT